jgi:hypothetical protein
MYYKASKKGYIEDVKYFISELESKNLSIDITDRKYDYMTPLIIGIIYINIYQVHYN